MYHGVVERVTDPDLDAWCITAEDLTSQLEALARDRSVVPLSRIVEAIRSGQPLDPRWVSLTFDDAYRGLFDHARAILRRLGLPWTVFVPVGLVGAPRTEPRLWAALCCLRSPRSEITVSVGGRTETRPLGSRAERLALRLEAARTPGLPEAILRAFGGEAVELLDDYPALQVMTWDALAALAGDGAALEAHGWEHRLLDAGLAIDLFEEEIQRPRLELRRRGFPCRYFCATYGVVDGRLRERARAAGYEGLVTSDPGHVGAAGDAFALPRLRADVGWRELRDALG